jgi:alkylhydroperoxidase family enzyme
MKFARSSSEEIGLNKQGMSNDPKRGAAALFAKTVAEKRGNIEDADLAAVQAAGWRDADVVAIVALAAQFLMMNFLNNVARTTADFPSVVEQAASARVDAR